MSERKITFAGPPPRRFPWLRAGIVLTIAGAIAAAAVSYERHATRRELDLAEKQILREGLHREHLAHARVLWLKGEATRPPPERPITASETAALLLGGGPPEEILKAYHESRPYEGPPAAELEAELARRAKALDALYGRAAGAGLARDDLDRWLAQGATATAIGPNILQSIDGARARTGLPPLR